MYNVCNIVRENIKHVVGQRMIEQADIRGMLDKLKETRMTSATMLDALKEMDALKETRMISGTGAFGGGVHVDEERAGATTRRVVRPSLHGQYSATGGVRFANPDISYVDCAIDVDVRRRAYDGQSIQPEKTVDMDGIAVYTYRLTADNQHDVYVENRSGRDIVMQHAYIGEDRCEERREIFNALGGERPDVFFRLGVRESKNVQSIHKEMGEPMDGVDIRTVVGRTVVKLRFVV